MGHPVLNQAAENVENPKSPEIAAIIKDMLETLEDAGGLGLAAPQVHILKRIVVFFVPESRSSVKINGGGLQGVTSGREKKGQENLETLSRAQGARSLSLFAQPSD